MRRWFGGLICLLSLMIALVVLPKVSIASDFTISVPVELRNIPTSAGPLTILVELLPTLDAFALAVKVYNSDKFIINPPAGVATYDFVQTVKFNLDVLPPHTSFEVGAYSVTIRYAVGTSKILLSAANFIDTSKPNTAVAAGTIKKQ